MRVMTGLGGGLGNPAPSCRPGSSRRRNDSALAREFVRPRSRYAMGMRQVVGAAVTVQITEGEQ